MLFREYSPSSRGAKSDEAIQKKDGTAAQASPARSDDEERTGKVFINETQYFGGVPEAAWEFYIGGYQPAQKWLKDRKGRRLTTDDKKHWQRIVVALTETGRIMNEIDKIEFLPN